ncbi:hypothetical protein ABEV37_02250 [Chromobacterium piscinae]
MRPEQGDRLAQPATPTSRFKANLAVLPAPRPPKWWTPRPSAHNSGLAHSTSASAPPTRKCSVPWLASCTLPVIGASTSGQPAAADSAPNAASWTG